MVTDWALVLKPGEPFCAESKVPEKGAGFGCVDGPRGALGHWIEIENKKIARYQLVVPTTWNSSPKDEHGLPGPMEQALIGAKVKDAGEPRRAGAHRPLVRPVPGLLRPRAGRPSEPERSGSHCLTLDICAERLRKRAPASGAIAVVGVGNLLMGDDGVGIAVIRELGKEAAARARRALRRGHGAAGRSAGDRALRAHRPRGLLPRGRRARNAFTGRACNWISGRRSRWANRSTT